VRSNASGNSNASTATARRDPGGGSTTTDYHESLEIAFEDSNVQSQIVRVGSTTFLLDPRVSPKWIVNPSRSTDGGIEETITVMRSWQSLYSTDFDWYDASCGSTLQVSPFVSLT
jgi:hypothetical protein